LTRPPGNTYQNQYGRCDREIECTYHLNPYKDGYSKMIVVQVQNHASKGDKERGFDIADFLIRLNWKDFRK